MTQDGSLSAATAQPLPTAQATRRWQVPALQSGALLLVLYALSQGLLSFYLAVPLMLLIVWLPRLARPKAAAPASSVDNNEIAALTRDLSYSTSHNALSAAGVAYSVRQLAGRVQSQLDSAARIVSSAEAMIHTEQLAAQLSQQALSAASEAHRSSAEGSVVLGESITRMHRLSQSANDSRELIEALSQRSEDIQRVALVIQSIASQTNLLALNAAIEAARAGDAGRGFAVVADEVRALAHRTQQSTQEIEQMIGGIQLGTEQAVSSMQQSNSRARSTLELAKAAGAALEEIAGAITLINERNTVIASASEEQAAVAREVDRNLMNIRDLAMQTSAGANQTSAASQELSRLAVDLNTLVARFSV